MLKEENHLDPKRILQAISIVKQLNEKYFKESEKKPLFDAENESAILLQVTMKKVPPTKFKKSIKVHLPTPVFSDRNEVCLITGDLDKHNTKAEVEPDVLHFKEILKKENITQVNEVISLRQLRKEYKPYEARRQLCGAYDVFLCDKKIAGVLPSTLGKVFFKKRKLPIQINMTSKNLKGQIESALSTSVFHISCRGNSCASQVADISMKEEDILANIASTVETLKKELPGKWSNVLGIYLKTFKSKAIPLYMSNDNPNQFKFSKRMRMPESVVDELSTLPDVDVKVFKDGRVIIKRLKEGSPELDEEDKSDVCVEQNVEESDMEEAEDADTCVVKNDDKSSRKRQYNSESNEENSEVKPKKKSKKRKSNLELTEDSLGAGVKEESILNFPDEKMEKKSKKRRSSAGFINENAEVEVSEEVMVKNSKSTKSEKRKNRKSNVGVIRENAEVEEKMDENFKTAKSEKSKKRKSNVGVTEENAVFEDEMVKNSKCAKSEKSKKRSNVEVIEENAEVEEKMAENSKSAKSEKRKSDVGSIEENEVVEEMIKRSKSAKSGKTSKKRNSSIGVIEENAEVREIVQVEHPKIVQENVVQVNKKKVKNSVEPQPAIEPEKRNKKRKEDADTKMNEGKVVNSQNLQQKNQKSSLAHKEEGTKFQKIVKANNKSIFLKKCKNKK